MLSSITPLGERARGRTWGVTAGFYVAGSLLGGLVLGAIAGGIGALVPAGLQLDGRALGYVLAGLLAITVAFEVPGSPLRVPSIHRQVDENWLDLYRGWVVGFGFGAQLGFGVVTIITSATTYLMIALMFMTHSVGWAVLIGAAFGLARAVPVLLVGGADAPVEVRRTMATTSRLGPVVRGAASMALVVGGLVVASGVVL